MSIKYALLYVLCSALIIVSLPAYRGFTSPAQSPPAPLTHAPTMPGPPTAPPPQPEHPEPLPLTLGNTWVYAATWRRSSETIFQTATFVVTDTVKAITVTTSYTSVEIYREIAQQSGRKMTDRGYGAYDLVAGSYWYIIQNDQILRANQQEPALLEDRLRYQTPLHAQKRCWFSFYEDFVNHDQCTLDWFERGNATVRYIDVFQMYKEPYALSAHCLYIKQLQYRGFEIEKICPLVGIVSSYEESYGVGTTSAIDTTQIDLTINLTRFFNIYRRGVGAAPHRVSG